MKSVILKYVLKNVHEFGSVNQKVVLGLVLREIPDLKKDVPSVLKVIAETVKEVEKLSSEEIIEKLKEIDPSLLEKEEKKKKKKGELPELKGAEQGKVVTRLPPEPSKYLHLGHAASFLINYLYSLKYEGKCILRFEDTNPEKASEEFVESIKHDIFDYLGVKPFKTVFVSDHMEKYYLFVEKLINHKQVYTCHCLSEKISKYRRAMKACSCRKKSWEGIKLEWEQMKTGNVAEGSVTLRLKIDMQHKNAVMRDPVIFRLSYKPHYRQQDKYKVWPMYDFENAIEEGLQGITHVLRSNEFASRIELQDYIRGLFDLPNPIVRQYARFNIAGATTKGREIRSLIESGEYIGWDDPRLVTLQALRRRGIVKEAFYELAKIVGLSKTTSNLDFSVLAAINRKLLDEQASRLYAIFDPVSVVVSGATDKKVELDLHPHKRKGGRKFIVNGSFYLSKKDVDSVKEGEVIRLIGCYNIKKVKDEFVYDSEENIKGIKKVHWLPVDSVVSLKVLMDNAKWQEGYAEETIEKLKEGEIVQFERTFFARLDSKKDKEFWYTHT
ncbi:glutamate--tRNA ligase [Candidatus Woesearchaeota archaeon]|nr:glutamate--tRNA ligase [Candidatus Woesearchaeota archaeon]